MRSLRDEGVNFYRLLLGGRLGTSLHLLARVVVALPPVASECDEAPNYIGGQPGRARDMPERRIFILCMHAVLRPHLRLPACQYPSGRTRCPAQAILHHGESAGGNPLTILKLPERPLGHPGRLGKCPPIPHAQLDPARNDVISEPQPVLASHVTVLPASRRPSPHRPVTILIRRSQKSLATPAAARGKVLHPPFVSHLTHAIFFLSIPVRCQ